MPAPSALTSPASDLPVRATLVVAAVVAVAVSVVVVVAVAVVAVAVVVASGDVEVDEEALEPLPVAVCRSSRARRSLFKVM